MSDREDVAAAVEMLRKATVEGNGAVLRTLLLEELTYGHSNGRIERKADVLETLDGKAAFRAIAQSNQTIEVVADSAVVRHTFDAERNLPEGGVAKVHIAIIQVWQRVGGHWRLFARHASPLTV